MKVLKKLFRFQILSFCILKVAIVAQDLAAFHSASPEIGHQQHGHHLVTAESRPVTLLATSNGTQIAVQVSGIRRRPCQVFIFIFMKFSSLIFFIL